MQLRYFFAITLMGMMASTLFDARAQQATSLHPEVTSSTDAVIKKSAHSRYYSPQRATRKAFRKPNVKHTARYEFYDRVEKAAREKKKLLRILSRKQYSDPQYFGHKRIPKRRSPSKMRFCDECGIRH